ncbi:MAG: cation:dicarboxylase symporter family transporter, partial [Acidobacteria bacterium]|nr:cation:dicarboxylase symporter family transporter [Acidobacteriota bacterium]
MNPSLHQGPWYFRLHWQIALALGAGLALGFGVGEAAVPWVGWLGTAFIRLLRMVIVPLVITSITSGIASVGSGRSLGRLGAKTLAYYITTSVLAILVGLVLVNVIQPGSHSDLTTAERVEVEQLDTPGSLSEIFMRLIPLNPVAAAASGDMLGLIFFAILMGIALTRLPPRPSDMLRGLFDSGFELMMVIAGGVIRLAPLGFLGLITTAVADKGVESFKPLGWYMLTVASGLAIHLFVT